MTGLAGPRSVIPPNPRPSTVGGSPAAAMPWATAPFTALRASGRLMVMTPIAPLTSTRTASAMGYRSFCFSPPGRFTFWRGSLQAGLVLPNLLGVLLGLRGLLLGRGRRGLRPPARPAHVGAAAVLGE